VVINLNKWLDAYKQKNNTETHNHRSAIGAIGQWDEPKALGILQGAHELIKQHYPDGALPWAAEHSPEHYRAVKDAEAKIAAMFKAQDIAGSRKAIGEYKAAFDRLIKTYSRQRILTTDEIIKAFDCGRVWELAKDKAAELDGIFAKEGVRWQV